MFLLFPCNEYLCHLMTAVLVQQDNPGPETQEKLQTHKISTLETQWQTELCGAHSWTLNCLLTKRDIEKEKWIQEIQSPPSAWGMPHSTRTGIPLKSLSKQCRKGLKVFSPSTAEWIDGTWFSCTVEYYSARQRVASWIAHFTWWRWRYSETH